MAGAGAYRGGFPPGRVMGSQDARGGPIADKGLPSLRPLICTARAETAAPPPTDIALTAGA